MTLEYILTGLLIGSLVLNVYVVSGQQKLRGLIRTGLRKAELDNCDRVRLPYNQVAEIMGWEPEFNAHGARTSVYPFREARDFNQKPGRHPATLSPARRKKL